MHRNVLTAATLAVVASIAGAAAAQTPAAPVAATHGPPINGICVISVEGAIGASTVGKFVDGRMQQIVAQVNAELTGERTGIDNEAKTLEGQRATLDRTVLEQRAAALQVRANALQRKAQQRDREVAATEQKAISRIGTEMEPMIRQAYQAKSCSVLFQRNALVIANPAMDITPQVVTALNSKITQFAFDRERLDQAAAAPQTGAARPAAAPATPTRR